MHLKEVAACFERSASAFVRCTSS